MDGELPPQLYNQVVDVTGWPTNDDANVFPIGSKPKHSVICPDNCPYPFLIPGHAYLFKGAVGWRAQQMWSEIIAYRLSKLCDLEVPPCFVALDKGSPGVLMEFFYGYPEQSPPSRLIHGTDLIQRFVKAYDTKTGRPHCVVNNIVICRLLKVPLALDWWAKLVAFDALLGNTDRHAQNWGVLRSQDDYKLAPAFDNGTSLGYMIRETELDMSDEDLAKHIAAGHNHVTWHPNMEKRGDPFLALCNDLCTSSPRAKKVVDRLLPTPDAPIAEILSPLTRFDIPVRFSPERATFVERLLRARRASLASGLGL